MLNQAQIIGRLGKDPVFYPTNTGTVVVKFSVATSEKYKDKSGQYQEQTEWHNVVVFAKNDKFYQILRKGALVYVTGKLNTQKYTGKDNVVRYSTSINASYPIGKVQLLERLDKPAERDEAGEWGGHPGEAADSDLEQQVDNVPF